ncbi:MAG TPA: MoxR family ATPase [Candidatus Acidoferrales bacterium]
MENLSRLASHVRNEYSKVIIGQRDVIDQMLLVLVCGGHALMEGVPGLAKTLAVKTLARICGLGFQRVQCTADLMPADIMGTNVFNMATSSFALHRGPVFTDLLLVDEINRTSPRTQAALLEAMEERQVTIDGTRYALSGNFTVLATQNPIEFEGTYPLPEAQLDRFLLKIRVGYPSEKEEAEILERWGQGFDSRRFEAIELAPIDAAWLAAARQEIESVRVEPTLYKYLVTLVRRTRDWPALTLGASPRAAIGLFSVARALAGIEGRDFLIPDDIKTAAPAVLRHRIMLKPEADLEGLTADQVVSEILAAVEVPK